jgi:hypothetical protein
MKDLLYEYMNMMTTIFSYCWYVKYHVWLAIFPSANIIYTYICVCVKCNTDSKG